MRKEEKNAFAIKDICKKMIADYDAVLKKYSLLYSGIFDTEWLLQTRISFQAIRKAWLKRFVLNMFNVFVLLTKSRKCINKKYIFVGLRYKELLTGIPSNEILIIARGKSDMSYALKNNIPFIFSYSITYYFLRACLEGNQAKLENEMCKFFKLFSLQQKICYLILTSDTKPDEMFFLSLASQFSGIFRVLCVQHGIYNNFEKDKFLVVDGERTPFNLIYNESQREIMSRYIKNSELLIMGPPWNLPCVIPEGDRDVILVGTDEGSPYSDIFQQLSKLLKADKIDHTYRPHPADKNILPDDLLNAIDARSKEDLLSGKPKIFIGFISTLLFEAYMSGHTVYSIVIDKQIARCSFDVDGYFSVKDLPVLCSTIAGQPVVKKLDRDQNFQLSLSERFMKAIGDIEYIISKRKMCDNGGR